MGSWQVGSSPESLHPLPVAFRKAALVLHAARATQRSLPLEAQRGALGGRRRGVGGQHQPPASPSIPPLSSSPCPPGLLFAACMSPRSRGWGAPRQASSPLGLERGPRMGSGVAPNPLTPTFRKPRTQRCHLLKHQVITPHETHRVRDPRGCGRGPCRPDKPSQGGLPGGSQSLTLPCRGRAHREAGLPVRTQVGLLVCRSGGMRQGWPRGPEQVPKAAPGPGPSFSCSRDPGGTQPLWGLPQASPANTDA